MDQTVRKALIIFFFCLFNCAFGKTSKESFLSANKLYRSGDWHSALTQYQSIETKNDSVWYNMGNCYYQQENYPNALVCWYRSLPLSSYSSKDDIFYNIEKVLKKCGVISSSGFVPNWLLKISTTIPLIFLQLLFLLFWYAFFLFWFKGARFKWHFSLTLLSFLLAALMAVIVVVAYTYNPGKRAIVMSKECVILSGPHENFDVLDTLFQAEQVEIEHQRNDWLKIKTPRAIGWISAKHLEVI